MLPYINLVLIIILTCSLVIGLILLKNKYEDDINKQDDTLGKLFKQVNKNDEYLKDFSLKNKDEVQKLITKNSNDLGENRGLIAENVGLVDAVVSRLDTRETDVTEGFQNLTVEDIRQRQQNTLQNILSMQLPGSPQTQTSYTGTWDAGTPTGCVTACDTAEGSGTPGTVTCSTGDDNDCDPNTKPDAEVCPATAACGTWTAAAATGCATACGTAEGSGTPGSVSCSTGSDSGCDADTKPDAEVCPATAACGTCDPSSWADSTNNNFTADCTSAVTEGVDCNIINNSGYENGSVTCTSNGYQATPATAEITADSQATQAAAATQAATAAQDAADAQVAADNAQTAADAAQTAADNAQTAADSQTDTCQSYEIDNNGVCEHRCPDNSFWTGADCMSCGGSPRTPGTNTCETFQVSYSTATEAFFQPLPKKNKKTKKTKKRTNKH